MRLIDADKLISDLKAMERVYDAIALDGMIQGIKSRPTVDAVEVVRCRECIMRMELIGEEERLFSGKALRCSMTGYVMLADDFCSYGEKVEEGAKQ